MTSTKNDFLRFDRRVMVKGAGYLAAGLVLRGNWAKADAKKTPLAEVRGGDANPDLFISILPEGKIELTVHRSEMGQHVWTSVAQVLAEELEANWEDISIVQAIGHPKYGDQNTDGSRSIRRNLYRLRVTGAALRHQLEQAAAQQWNVPVTEVQGSNSYVIHKKSKRKLSYASLTEAAAKLPLPAEEDIKLKDRSEWRYIGKPIPSLTVPKIIRGQGTYGIDVNLPNMAYAVIARPPQVLGSVKEFDDSEAKKVAGALGIFQLPKLEKNPVGFQPLGGVVVVAKNTWTAIKARKALKIKWNSGPNGKFESDAYKESLLNTANKKGDVRRNRGDTYAALDKAKTKVSADYYVPLLAHASMEMPSATARWNEDGTVECWACVQAPQQARKQIAEICKVPEDKVTVHITWLGGGFGRKSKPDFAVEAALIAKVMKRPVKLTWTREDDLQHSYYHTVSAQHLEGAISESGKVEGWLHRSVFPPIASTFAPGANDPTWGELGLGAADNPLEIPNLRLETGKADAHVRIGWLRSVANIYHAFAIQSFVAELADAGDKDPKDMLIELLGKARTVDPNKEGSEYSNYGDPMEEYPIDVGRLIAVSKKVADMAGWGRKLKAGHGLGIACHRSFLSYVATVVEVSVSPEGAISIPKVWSAVDAGTVVNTKHTTAQIEGGTLFGLSNALYGEITAKNGVINQANYPDWRVMRMSEAPRDMEVYITPSDAPPGGVGEPGTPPAAPALANAIFAATGQRVRTLPILGPNRDKLDLSNKA